MARKLSAPKSVAAVPIIKPGAQITAAYLNNIADLVNDTVLQGPRDLDEGEQQEAPTEYSLEEVSRTTTTTRIENPEDENQYVNVERVDTVTMNRLGTAEVWLLTFTNE